MKEIIILLVVIVIGALALNSLIKDFDKPEKHYLGKKVVIMKDTLLIIDTHFNSYVLSNGTSVNYRLIDKLNIIENK